MQRLYRSPFETKLTVVVVFNDGGVYTISPVQQGESPRQRHRYSERVLVRWRHVHQTRIPWQLVHHYSFVVDRHAAHFRAERLKKKSRRVIARIFNRDSIARRQQGARDEIERLLRATRDRYVVSRNLHTARDADVSRNRFAQTTMSCRLRVHSSGHRFGTQCTNDQPSPRLVRKQRCVGKTSAKVKLRRLVESSRQCDRIPHRARLQRASEPARLLLRRAYELVVDVCARSNSGDDEAFTGEAIVCLGDRSARHVERVREVAACGQAIAGSQTAVTNRISYLAIDLATQVLSTDEIDLEVH